MTMKAIRTLSALGLAVGIVATASAVPDATGVRLPRVPGYFTFPGGEFTVIGVDDDIPNVLSGYAPQNIVTVAGQVGFQSFCLEYHEGLSGQPFDAYLNTKAVYGGVGPAGDPISIGTALLYKWFATGTLPGYNYTPGLGREASAKELQEAIWWLEDEITLSNPLANTFLALLGDPWAAKADYDPNTAGFTVRVLNMYVGGSDPNDPNNKRQDILVYLPDGGMTLILMGGGLLGLALIRRKE